MTAIALAVLLAASPFRAEEPHVRAGNERLLGGDAEGALRSYADAERAAGARPEIAYDRGQAHFRKGELERARDAFREALAREPGALASRAFQNLGSALDGLGDREGAIAALREALVRDPSNADARYNLEVLLRRKEESAGPVPRPSPRGPGGADREPGRGPPERGRDPDRERAPEASGAGREERQEAAAARPEIPRQDAERLLDALRARERSAPLFGPRREEGRRRDAEKDW
jgi:Ca-activated chloride channel family protein